ncbi:hypothetical protein [Acetobacterium wieringae]|nr:hypothetical protein [Acetobacterium wieringae]MEA4805784.1 hypothetical protein [Acetobacterium wieringae]
MSDITIGEFAKLTRCTSKTILYYQKSDCYKHQGDQQMGIVSMGQKRWQG